MIVRDGIKLDDQRLRAFGRKHMVKELGLFGSILRDDFGPDSDVDFLVRIEYGERMTVDKLLSMEDELSALVGRRVDIVLGSEIDAPDANPFRRQRILATVEPVYAR